MCAFDGGLTPDGCVPLLPSRCVMYGRCFGEPTKPLPDGVSVDIEERPIVSTSVCFKTPSSDTNVRKLGNKGQALAFFASDVWSRRLEYRRIW